MFVCSQQSTNSVRNQYLLQNYDVTHITVTGRRVCMTHCGCVYDRPGPSSLLKLELIEPIPLTIMWVLKTW